MSNLLLNKSDRFFVIFLNGTVQEYLNVQEAINQKNKLTSIVDKFKEAFSPPGGEEWRISDFAFISDHGDEYKLSDKNWIIEAIDIVYKSSTTILYQATISDPDKVIRRVKKELKSSRKIGDLNSNDIEVVKDSLQELYKHSKYSNWSIADIVSENIRLKDQISVLNKKNQGI